VNKRVNKIVKNVDGPTQMSRRLPRNLALEQTVHFLAFGESASQQTCNGSEFEDEFEDEDD